MPYTITVHTRERDELMIALAARRDYLTRQAHQCLGPKAQQAIQMRALYVDGILAALRDAQPGIPARVTPEGLER